jgi:SAM-dependent methyltransferase
LTSDGEYSRLHKHSSLDTGFAMQKPFALLRTKILNMFWENRLNISTRGVTGKNPNEPEHIHYGTIAYSTIHAILCSLSLSPSDVFVDLGCGKGRVLCCAARYKILQAIGVEYSAELSREAKINAEKLRGRSSPIKIEHMLAQNFDYSQGTVFYMFHPFGPNVLYQVLKRMKDGFKANHLSINIVYVNPVHDALLTDCDWLEEYDRWKPNTKGNNEHVVSFWRSKNP